MDEAQLFCSADGSPREIPAFLERCIKCPAFLCLAIIHFTLYPHFTLPVRCQDRQAGKGRQAGRQAKAGRPFILPIIYTWRERDAERRNGWRKWMRVLGRTRVWMSGVSGRLWKDNCIHNTLSLSKRDRTTQFISTTGRWMSRRDLVIIFRLSDCTELNEKRGYSL